MAQSGSEQRFTLRVPDADIDLLKRKLELTRFPDELQGAGLDYGAPLADVQRLVARWQSGFDWRKCEDAINEIPQFTRDIELEEGFGTLNVHYVHQRSEIENAVPLLFVHGWPGHFLEVRKLLPLLTAKSAEHPSFHVVALSLPGFGFSQAPKKTGFGPRQYAEVANKLMISLGYNQYVLQGGDWGHYISGITSGIYGHKHVKAWLSNYPLALPPTFTSAPLLYLTHMVTPYTEREIKGLERRKFFTATGAGYMQEQATKPQTLGYSLADSPAGVLAWIYEKLIVWSDDYPWSDDEVLEWVSVYWFSRGGPAASLRIYKEMTHNLQHPAVSHVKYSSIPFGVACFPKELSRSPRTWLQNLGNLVYEGEHDKGGHFAAHEQPEALASDIRKMFGKGGPAFGVVDGKNGYA